MGKRLTQIATRTGDDGTTGLGDGTRVDKDALRVHAMGDVDELNSVLGVLVCEDLPADVRAALSDIQHDLFDLGGELSIPGYTMVTEAQVASLDGWLATCNATLPRLAEFILPGGSRAASIAHVAADRRASGRAQRRRARAGRGGPRRGPALPQPAVRPALRLRARAQSPRRRYRRAVAEEQEFAVIAGAAVRPSTATGSSSARRPTRDPSPRLSRATRRGRWPPRGRSGAARRARACRPRRAS